MPLDSSKFERRFKELMQMFDEDVPKFADEAAESVQLEIAARSPSHEEEYDSIMVGEGGTPTVPLSGDRSADTDGRTRFQKEPGTWLQDVASVSGNRLVQVDGTRTRVLLGNMMLLNRSARFSFTNLFGKERMPITHESGSYFDFFENGASYVVVPTHQSTKQYPLRPDETQKFFEFPKSISAHRAYFPEVLNPIFQESVKAALSALNFNANK